LLTECNEYYPELLGDPAVSDDWSRSAEKPSNDSPDPILKESGGNNHPHRNSNHDRNDPS
jgi:hypothetical protein